MKQFKALLLKEWQTNWKGFLMPVWICLGVYLTILLGFILSQIKGNDMTFLTGGSTMTPASADSLLLSVAMIVTAVLGFVGILNASGLADHMINGGYKRKCEILHLSQPVSLLKILGSKYLIMTLGTILLITLLSLINNLGISLIMHYYTGAQIYYGFMGWLVVSLELALSLIFASSLFWFFASVFTKKSAAMGILSVVAIQTTTIILNYMAGFKIPYLGAYLLRLGTVSVDSNSQARVMKLVTSADATLAYRWSLVWNWDSLMKVSLSAVFFVLAYYLIKRRELR